MTQALSDKPLFSPRKQPRQSRSKATFDSIVDAAAQLLETEAYDKISTNLIASYAGVSIGSLYEYFPGKEAIFAEIRRRENSRLFEIVMANPFPSTVRETLRLHISSYLTLVTSNLPLHAALAQDVPQFAAQANSTELTSKYLFVASAFLADHRDELRPECSVEMIAHFLHHVIVGTISNLALRAPEMLNDRELTDQIYDMVENYALQDRGNS